MSAQQPTADNDRPGEARDATLPLSSFCLSFRRRAPRPRLERRHRDQPGQGPGGRGHAGGRFRLSGVALRERQLHPHQRPRTWRLPAARRRTRTRIEVIAGKRHHRPQRLLDRRLHAVQATPTGRLHEHWDRKRHRSARPRRPSRCATGRSAISATTASTRRTAPAPTKSLLVTSCGADGIHVQNSAVANVRSWYNGDRGIWAFESLVRDSVAYYNKNQGILGTFARIADNQAGSNGTTGIEGSTCSATGNMRLRQPGRGDGVVGLWLGREHSALLLRDVRRPPQPATSRRLRTTATGVACP